MGGGGIPGPLLPLCLALVLWFVNAPSLALTFLYPVEDVETPASNKRHIESPICHRARVTLGPRECIWREMVFSSKFYDFGRVLFFPKGQKHLLVPSHEVMKCCFHM